MLHACFAQMLTRAQGVKISPKSRRGCKVGKEPGRARVSAASLTPYFPIWCSVKHFRELLLVKSQSWVPESRFKNSSKSFPLEGACHSHQCIKVPEKPYVNMFNSISLSYPKYILGTWNFFFFKECMVASSKLTVTDAELQFSHCPGTDPWGLQLRTREP